MSHNPVPAYVQNVLDRLQGLRPTHDGWDALCPCPGHNGDGDQHPSLRVGLGQERQVLLKCRVGCLTDAVLEAVGLEWQDLFPSDSDEPLGLGGDETAALTAVRSTPPADVDVRDRAYTLLLGQLELSDDHRADLRRRGLPGDEIDRRGYRSLRNIDRGRSAKVVHEELGDAMLAVPGFVRGPFGTTLHGDSTGLVVPVRDLKGRVTALKLRRAAEPKYVYLSGGPDGPSAGSPAHVPLGVAAPATAVRVTEGELKADVCHTLDGTPTVGVPGVARWREAIPVLRELEARTVILAYDAPDVRTKAPVFEQAEAFFRQLTDEGFEVELEDWDDEHA